MLEEFSEYYDALATQLELESYNINNNKKKFAVDDINVMHIFHQHVLSY